MKKYKVYTKTGDTGTTSLLGGVRVEKNHPRIEAYGTLDELNVYLGAIRDYDIGDALKEDIVSIQRVLMKISSVLAAANPNSEKIKPLIPQQKEVEWLEKKIDEMEETLPPLKYFVIPGGDMAVTACHKARVVCRKAERNVVALTSIFQVPVVIITYLNRLSDYLFVLGRKIASNNGFMETPWIP